MASAQTALLAPSPAQSASLALGYVPAVGPNAAPPSQVPPVAQGAPPSSGGSPPPSSIYGVPTPLIAAVMKVESGGNPGAVSPKGAIGPMQLMPETAADMGVDPSNPGQNVLGGAKYLSTLMQKYGGDMTKALMAYNWGPQKVDDWIKAGANPADVPPSVAQYVQHVKTVQDQDGGAAGSDLAGQIQGTIAANDALFAQGQAAQAPIFAQMMQTMSQDRARFDKIADSYTPYQPPPPPAQPATDPLRGFGSAAAIFAFLASMFTHTPAIAAMNGISSAMNAMKQNDWNAYQDSYKRWQDATSNMLAQHKLQAQDMQQALETMQTDLSTGVAMAKVVASQSQDKIAQNLLDLGEYDKLFQLQAARNTAAQNLEKNAIAIQEAQPQLLASQAWTAAYKALQAAQASGDPAAIAKATQSLNFAQLQLAFAKNPGSSALKPGTRAAIVTENYNQIMAANPNIPPDEAWNRANHMYDVSNASPSTQFGNPSIATVKNKDGTMTTVFVQQDKTTGQWVTADQNRSPVDGVISTSSATNAVSPDDPAVKNVAKMIASYKMAPMSGYVLSTPFGQAVMGQVSTINPNYNASKWGAYEKAQRDFATGPLGNTVRSVSTAIAHLGTLDKLIDALNNNDSRAANAALNLLSRQFGGTSVTNFNTAKQIVGQEVIKAIIAGGGGEAERQQGQNAFDAASSPAQLRGAIGVVKQLMAGQLTNLSRQYQDTTGGSASDFSAMLSPDARSQLDVGNGGSAPSAAGAPPLPGARQAPDGRWYVADPKRPGKYLMVQP